MKILFIILIGIITSINGFSQDKFIGIWINQKDNQEIEIFKEGEFYYAKNNTKNDDELVLNQMVVKNESKLFGGTYFDKKLNLEIEAKIIFIHPNILKIKIIRGIGLFNSVRTFIKK